MDISRIVHLLAYQKRVEEYNSLIPGFGFFDRMLPLAGERLFQICFPANYLYSDIASKYFVRLQ